MCEKRGISKAATIVDHKKEWKKGKTEAERYELMWNTDNWQGLCATCHSGVKRRIDNHGFSQACGVDGLPTNENHPFNRGKE